VAFVLFSIGGSTVLLQRNCECCIGYIAISALALCVFCCYHVQPFARTSIYTAVSALRPCNLLQVAAGACALQLQLPNRLLADMTERAAMLEASQQADPYDVQLLQAAMDRLARAAVAAPA
jgi:hypothetical protein